jgi:uncharacterized protein
MTGRSSAGSYGSRDPWPEPPELPQPVITTQEWLDAVFLHWRIPEAVAATRMPPGVRPDTYDGSSWVGLVGFRLHRATIASGPVIPYLGTFTEVNVRLYSREPSGRRGVVFLSMDASRLAFVVAARAARIPYVWSGAHFRPPLESRGGVGYSVRRFRHGATSDFSVAPARAREANDPLSIHLTARFGLHTRLLGRTLYWPNAHAAWPLYRAELTSLDDQLIAAAGIKVSGPPESVLYSPGVRSTFGRPQILGRS